mgnify:CR=1 FL=1
MCLFMVTHFLIARLHFYNFCRFCLCKLSIIGQCAFYNFSRPLRERVMGIKNVLPEEIDRMARHIASFSLGGLKQIQKQTENRN